MIFSLLATSDNDDDCPYQVQKVTDNGQHGKESVMVSVISLNVFVATNLNDIRFGAWLWQPMYMVMAMYVHTYIHGPLESYS